MALSAFCATERLAAVTTTSTSASSSYQATSSFERSALLLRGDASSGPVAFGLAAVGGRSFAELARLVICFSLGFTVWEYLGTPIFNHYGWGYWIYSFIAESVSLIVAGLIVARWFMPHYRTAAAEAASPTEA